jgi:hypothetical protein
VHSDIGATRRCGHVDFESAVRGPGADACPAAHSTDWRAIPVENELASLHAETRNGHASEDELPAAHRSCIEAGRGATVARLSLLERNERGGSSLTEGI